MSSSRNDPIVIADSDTEDEVEEQCGQDSHAVDDDHRANKRVRISRNTPSNVDNNAQASGSGCRHTLNGLDTDLTAHNGDVTNHSNASGPPFAMSREERLQLEQQRKERQRQRRIAAGLRSTSPDDTDGNASDAKCPARMPRTLPSSFTSSSQSFSRTYTTEVNQPQSQLPPVDTANRLSGVANPRNNGAYREDRTTGASSYGPAATSGLGSSTRPALRRILADDRFPTGAVRRSWNRHTNDGVPFSDFFLPTTKSNTGDLSHAVVASYTYEFDWLQSILPTARSARPGQHAPQITFVTLQKPGELEPGEHETPIPGWLMIVIKAIGQYSTMHIKMVLLFYPDRLRLLVFSGNLQRSDWETLENAAYIQDFALLPGQRRDTGSEVYSQLEMVLSSLDIPRNHYARRTLSRFDLSRGPSLIASIGRRQAVTGHAIMNVGLGRLNAKVRELFMGEMDKGGLELEAQGSSMGTYSRRWLQQMHLVASGAAVEDVLPLPKTDGPATRHYQKEIRGSQEWPPIKILFPTDDFVRNRSADGILGGGCHYGKPEKFQKWRHLCHDVRSTRHDGILMHQKGLLGLRIGAEEQYSGPPDEVIGYIVMGSHNFTSSAWGNFSQATDGALQMTSSNWELSVFFPLRRSDLQPSSENSSLARSCICWKRPAQLYSPADIPWSATSI